MRFEWEFCAVLVAALGDGTDRGNNFAVDERAVDAATPIVVDMRYMGGFLARMGGK